ncbi:MAG: hypothetical protein KBE09_03800 [Candidatus Pacebacteria bacterium]|nr:hypothetical protein [Candidatus Paceibacterota bacterium]
MRGAFNESFFKFSIGFLCIILGSFGFTIALDYYDENYGAAQQTASVFESAAAQFFAQ